MIRRAAPGKSWNHKAACHSPPCGQTLLNIEFTEFMPVHTLCLRLHMWQHFKWVQLFHYEWFTTDWAMISEMKISPRCFPIRSLKAPYEQYVTGTSYLHEGAQNTIEAFQKRHLHLPMSRAVGEILTIRRLIAAMTWQLHCRHRYRKFPATSITALGALSLTKWKVVSHSSNPTPWPCFQPFSFVSEIYHFIPFGVTLEVAQVFQKKKKKNRSVFTIMEILSGASLKFNIISSTSFCCIRLNLQLLLWFRHEHYKRNILSFEYESKLLSLFILYFYSLHGIVVTYIVTAWVESENLNMKQNFI